MVDTIESEENIRNLMSVFRRLQFKINHEIFGSISPKQTPTQLFVLMRLERAKRHGVEGLRVSEVASQMGITMSAVTQLLTGLEKNGYIRREMDPSDRRAVRVFLTPAGESIMDPALVQLRKSFHGLSAHLGEGNTRKLLELLLEMEKYFSGGQDDCCAFGTGRPGTSANTSDDRR